jgi:hypothetical protein
MKKTEECVSWVVYRMASHKNAVGGIVICEQSEWDEMELACPGHHTLIQEGITSEVEAERLARSQPGCEPTSTVRLKTRS